MTESKEKVFWEEVNYFSGLKFCRELIEKILQDEDIHNKSVIDIGCGTGIYSLIFKQKGAKDVMGIDISESSIGTAKINLKKSGLVNVQFLNANFINYDFQDKRFDLIWCHGMIYYVSDPFETMRKICNLVAQKGVLFISLQKDTYYAKVINSIRKILHKFPKYLRNLSSSLISIIFFVVLFIFHKETNFSRIKTKVLAQYFPVNYINIKELKDFFYERNFVIEKIINSTDIFPYTTDFGLKLRRLN